jgi:orotidine-5'-phosphate decarboxylase
MTKGFHALLRERWTAANSLLCVGLDPDPARLPASVRNQPSSIARFCIDIVDATAEFACAFKPQIAYFAAAGAEAQLEAVCAHIRANHPSVPVILDAKRGDIGDTAKMYAREAFDRYGAHAVTVNPYMGGDTLAPYQEFEGRGIIVLCRTSNPGSGEFQSRTIDGEPLYKHVARRAADEWSVTSHLSWAPRTPPSSQKYARSWATCRCWCREWAHRAATPPRSSTTEQTRPAQGSS